VAVERGLSRSFPLDWHVDATGDFNADGTDDILWHGPNGEVVLWQMQDSAITVERQIGVADPAWDLAAAGDVNGDGNSDIVWRLPDSAVVSWEIDGSGALAVERGLGLFDPAAELVDSRDLNGDGTSDILFRQDSGYVVSWEMKAILPYIERGVGFFDNTWEIVT
jgi:hypothetical protein